MGKVAKPFSERKVNKGKQALYSNSTVNVSNAGFIMKCKTKIFLQP